MKALKTVIKYIITIILALSMIAYFFIQLASSTILSEQYILSKLEETDYYNKIYECVESNFENYIHQSGLEETVLENIVSKEKVRKDTNIIISNLYDGLEQKIDTQEIRDNLNKNIKETLGEQNITKTQQSSIDTFVDHICSEYTDTMSHFSYEKQINQYYQKAMQYINLAKKVLLITIGLAILLLLVLNLKRIYKFVLLLGISLTTTGTFLVIVNLFINSKVKVQTITILNDAISDTVRSVLADILHMIMNNGSIMLISGILLIIIPILIHNLKKYGMAKEEDTYEN